MSDQTTTMPVPPEPAGGSSRRGRRGLVVGGAAGLAVLLVGGGAFAAWQFFGTDGRQPADVLPADTLGLVSVDLDPAGGQKLEALRTLRKLPTFREKVGLEEDDDPAQALFERLQADEDLCPDLDYQRDVAPWIGQRFAIAAVPGASDGDEPQPVVVAQVSDPDAAREGAQALADCAAEAGSGDSGGAEGGFVVGDDYLVAAETRDLAQQVLDDGEESALSGDDDYQRWSDDVGTGIVTLYAAPAAAQALAGGSDEAAEALSQLEDFTGAAATLRFEDGGIALTGAAGLGKQTVTGGSIADHVGSLPDDTAALLAFGSSTESRQQVRDRLDDVQPGPADDVLGQVEGAFASVGLTFPDDLLTLLGDSLSISVGGQPPASLDDPTSVPAGLRIDGDPDAIQDVVDRAEQGIGFSLSDQGLTVDSDDDGVVASLDPAYADALLKSGALADDETFGQVVPDLDQAQAVVFVRFDSEWRDLLLQQAGASSEQTADLEELRAFGLSARNDDGTTRVEARLSLE